jgi:hypothetical protein
MWKTLPLDLPADQEVVWIRIKYYYGDPFLALWDLASLTFTSSVNSIPYPGYVVSRWKSQ